MAKTVNEKSPLYMTMTFKDEVGADLIPTTVDWRLDDGDDGTEIVDWTVMPTPAATMNMVVPGSNNLINDETNVRETRKFGIRVDDGLGTEAFQEFQYHVLNLQGATGV